MKMPMLVAVGLVVLATSSASAQTAAPAPAGYRDYALGASLASVIATSGAGDPRPVTLHERPERLQTYEWRARYSSADAASVDPVRSLMFSFVGDALYRIDVRYDPDRTLGLNSQDLVDAISDTYGTPQPEGRARSAEVRDLAGDMTAVRQWSLPEASLVLFRATYAPDYMLTLVSTPLAARAATAFRAAERLDLMEAPQRAKVAREQDARDAVAATARARARNKPAFRP